MRIDSKDIELFQNLSQYNFNGEYYDLHNDFNCTKILLENNLLLLSFKNLKNDFIVNLKFYDVRIVKLELDFYSESDSLTIDNLYRGRFENNKVLCEYSNDGESYFYLEFYEEKKMEFFSNGLQFEKI